VRNSPIVSVGMPAYNAEGYIEDSIRAILDQSYGDLELVICDNASTDATPEICRAAAAEDNRVRYVRNPENLGAAANYNLALDCARGQYFKWQSSNDLCHKDLIQSCIKALTENEDAVLAYARTRLFETDPGDGDYYPENLELDCDDPRERFLRCLEGMRLNNILNGIFRTSALRCGPRMAPLIGTDLVVTAAMTLYGKFIEVPHEYFYRRMDAGSATKLQGREAVVAHYMTSRNRRMTLQIWRLYFAYIAAVLNAPVSAKCRVQLTGDLLRRMIRARHALAHDLVGSLPSMRNS